MTEPYLQSCPVCGQRFSDWFEWSSARRYCYPCWLTSGYVKVVLDNGTILRLDP